MKKYYITCDHYGERCFLNLDYSGSRKKWVANSRSTPLLMDEEDIRIFKDMIEDPSKNIQSLTDWKNRLGFTNFKINELALNAGYTK